VYYYINQQLPSETHSFISKKQLLAVNAFCLSSERSTRLLIFHVPFFQRRPVLSRFQPAALLRQGLDLSFTLPITYETCCGVVGYFCFASIALQIQMQWDPIE